MHNKLLPAPSVAIKNAAVFYQDISIFSDLNISIEAGKCSSLLGKSGIGKSSLLKFIAGLINQKYISGDIQTSDSYPLADRLAYMSQQDTLLPWLNVMDNILIGTKLRGEKDRQEQLKTASRLLEKVGLASYENRKPHELSGGERQRITLVRTFIENRSVILMDEPFASLDAITRLSLQNLAVELFQGRTVLFVTHDPLEALRISHVVYVMMENPVKLEKKFVFSDEMPRSLEDTQLLKLQSELFQTLGVV